MYDHCYKYAAFVWSPYQLDDIAKIESVQRRFTKRLPGLSNTSYCDRSAVLSLRSLQLRRLHQDLIYTYKIIFGLVDLDCFKFFLISPDETTRGHVSKLFVRRSCVDVRKYFLEPTLLKFGIACQQQWKILPVCEIYFSFCVLSLDVKCFCVCAVMPVSANGLGISLGFTRF